MKPIIHVENLSKQYTIGAKVEPYSTLRESLVSAVRRPIDIIRRRRDVGKSADTEFWALRDVSFDVMPGEVVGIIGRNGAGKSTLLKILSRITEPTTGKVELYGRVGSLLEVGTGFHPELTGRENIFLNGAILGMRREEIAKKFDEIVDFAEIEEFLDTPVKRYSSGMYMRLAFAVAASLEPEVLVIDEVLAVGDSEFQKKCLGKMKDVSEHGRTVLFVSHNMNAIESLCQRILHLRQGRIVAITDDVRGEINSYLSDSANTHGVEWRNPGAKLLNPWFFPIRFYLGDARGRLAQMPVRNDRSVYVWIEGEVEQVDIALTVGYALYDDAGTLLYWSVQTDTAETSWPRLRRGRNVLRSEIPKQVLNQGKYRLELIVSLYYRDWVSTPGTNAPAIELSIQGGLSDSPYWMVKRPGLLAPVCSWSLENI